MTVQIESDGALPPERRRAIEQQARLALTRYSRRIRAVRVRVEGDDHTGCAVRIAGRKLEPVTAVARAGDASAALAEAIERARRAFERRLRQENEQ